MRFIILTLLLSTWCFATRQPNVVLVISDDQGFGDLGYTGNPVVKTPNIDKLIKESIWLEDYHVAPTCSPTRCSLLTGRWTNRTGVWHTINGRSMLRENEVTAADYLSNAGYETAIFGKWHLGDNYPYRPEDRGFTHTFYHGAGGIGQTPDIWNNDYFDDQFHKNGEIVQAEGYCTDVFFEEATDFIKECAKEGKPFFTYISTNAPHLPLNVPQEYYDLYKGKEGVSDREAAFFGMITNLDENVGKLRDLLDSLEVSDDTIFIFTTDNGTAHGNEFYNAGMKGKKGTEWEGGHHVPFALHWPYYGLDSHKSIPQLTHVVDILPTLLDFCEVELTEEEQARFDGVSLEALVGDKDTSDAPAVDWDNRCVVSDSQRVKDPIKWKQSSVMSGKWRLINGKELYHVKHDPGQETDIAEDFPQVAKRLADFYEKWWAELEPTFSQTTEIYVGAEECPIVELTAHDWIQDELPPWNQAMMRSGKGLGKKGGDKKFVGHWALKVLKTGVYNVTLRRWPKASGLAITASTPAMPRVPGSDDNYSATEGAAIPIYEAVLKVNGKEIVSTPVKGNSQAVTFKVKLPKGSHQLSPFFRVKDQGELGAYFCEVETMKN